MDFSFAALFVHTRGFISHDHQKSISERTAQTGIVAAAVGEIDVFSSRSSSARPLPPSSQELRIPAVISGGDLTLASATSQIYPGMDTNLLLINNSFPAPTIK